MNAIWNERTKILATWLNTVAAHCWSIGAVAPLVAVTYGATSALPNTPEGNETLVIGLALWIAVGLSLHVAAHIVLGELRS